MTFAIGHPETVEPRNGREWATIGLGSVDGPRRTLADRVWGTYWIEFGGIG